ncbi:unnamed protein product [Thlaspi arvense]|uniref:3-phosphoinositide-dependent protein kinase-1 n=1 Tax=Thlaspi arvense TaxID=13288 RepID=A0AAU9S3V8_THLAR|nr:unnamed protein product [Thlaspi arvense]
MEATGFWGEIERSESCRKEYALVSDFSIAHCVFVGCVYSYLVCSMYQEAESLSSSVLKQIFGNIDALSEEALGAHQLHDMLESTGMVLVQSLHGLGRTAEIVNELRQVFGDFAAIPVQVLLTGICLQISSGSYLGVREILEEFFSTWVYKDNRYIINDAGVSAKRFHGKISLDVDEYMEAVELYTFGVVGKVSNDMGLAISWVEKAALPEERRQGLLRRLRSLVFLKSEASSFEEDSSIAGVNNKKSLANDKNDEIDSVLKLSKQHEPWSSNPLSLKLGNTRYSMSRGKVAITLVGLIICYALKRKRAALIRIIRRQMESTKKAIVDFWKLAFSYQVNPLAAIQSIPSTAT